MNKAKIGTNVPKVKNCIVSVNVTDLIPPKVE
jgi:hypothetical protein